MTGNGSNGSDIFVNASLITVYFAKLFPAFSLSHKSPASGYGSTFREPIKKEVESVLTSFTPVYAWPPNPQM